MLNLLLECTFGTPLVREVVCVVSQPQEYYELSALNYHSTQLRTYSLAIYSTAEKESSRSIQTDKTKLTLMD